MYKRIDFGNWEAHDWPRTIRNMLQLAKKADKTGGPLPIEALRLAAESGYPPAVYAWANWHIHGKGVSKDLKKAVQLLKKAADKGYGPAQYDLAVSHESGEGVRKNLKTAFGYYLKAADGGDLDAQAELARCFFFGIGTAKSIGDAIKWYRKAAEQGDADSQYALAGVYERGEGVEQDIQAALRWYRIAASSGDAHAKKAAIELEAEIKRAFGQLAQAFASSEHSVPKNRKSANGTPLLPADQVRVLARFCVR